MPSWTLAGISIDYLIRLEQGRDRRPSTQVLAALADALQLDDNDRTHLQEMATISQGTELMCRQQRESSRSVRPTVQAVLDQLEPAPAYVVNRLGDVLSWTDGFDRLARPLGLLDRDRPNLVRYTFTDDRARAAFRDWDAFAAAQAAWLHEFRWGDSTADALAEEIGESSGADFTDRWDRRPLGARRTGLRELTHPQVGDLRLTYETLAVSEPDHQWLVVHVPADAATAAALDRLNGRLPGALRSVTAC